jgi:hypothetical protein
LLALFVIGLVTASLVTNASAGATLTIAPVADSWADSEDPGTNNGSGTYLRVDGSPLRHVYMRFDLSSLQAPVTHATLRLFSTDQSTRGYQAWSTSGSWSEASLN